MIVAGINIGLLVIQCIEMGSKGTKMYLFIKIFQNFVQIFQFFVQKIILKCPISENLT